MDKKRPYAVFSLFILILFSCAAQNNIFFPAPDKSIDEGGKSIEIGSITESRDMDKEPYLPDWLSAYFAGGIEEAEKLEAYAGKYLFITANDGENFAALSKWADNFSVEYDFPMLAAARIDKRMNVSSLMYPDDEYGAFYETFVKNAYSGEYRGAVKEDAYWIKTRVSGNNGAAESAALTEMFIFFVLISVDEQDMQAVVYNLFSQSLASLAPTRVQTVSINRLRINFFEGF